MGPERYPIEDNVHELLIGIAFVGMIVAPALVAVRSGRAETEPEDSPEITSARTLAAFQANPGSLAKGERPAPVVSIEATTLPLDRVPGMGGR
jgi:hypothetical protein